MGSRAGRHKRPDPSRPTTRRSEPESAREILRSEWITPRLEQALRWSARWHQGQTRKGGAIPYFQHVAAVAMILDRAGFDEDVVIAGLLHDVVEDTAATFEDVAARFGSAVAEQ